MNTYLVIKDNTVINTVLWDGESDWAAPEGTTTVIAPDDVPINIGWTKSGSNWIAPEPPAVPEPEPEDPNKVSARAKLAALGLTEAEITALIGA